MDPARSQVFPVWLSEALVEDEGEVGFVGEGFHGLFWAAVAGAAQGGEQGGAQEG